MYARMCPRCGSKSIVYDVRDRDGGVTLRSRRCVQCNYKWQTVELERWEYEGMLRKEAAKHD